MTHDSLTHKTGILTHGVPPGVSAAIFAFQSLRYHDIIKELYPFYIHIVLCKMLLLRMESGTQI